MVEVQEATFVPTATGGEMRATMRLGRREIITSWPVDQDDQDLRRLLDRMVSMKVGDQAFVSILSIEDEYRDLKPLLDRLLNEIGTNFLGTLRSALQEEERAAPQEAQPTFG
jgi:hypothetical protein